MAAKGAKVGKAFIEFSLADGKFRKSLGRASAKLKSFGRTVGSIGAKMSAVSAGMLAGFGGAMKAFAAMGDKIDKIAQRTGMGSEFLSALSFASQQTGQDIVTFEKTISRMQRTIYDAGRGLSLPNEALADLGLTLADVENLSPEEQFKLIAQRISQIEDPTKRAGVAMSIFGNSGRKMLPLLNDGANGINALMQEAEDLGIVLAKEDVSAAAELTDAFNRTVQQFKKFVFLIGASVAGEFMDFLKIVQNITVGILKWVDKNRAVILMVAKIALVIGAIGGALMGLGLFFTIAGVAAAGLATAIGVVLGAVAFLLSPIGLLIASVAALGTWLITSTDIGRQFAQKFMEYFQQLRDFGMRTFGALADALKAGDMTAAAEILWATLGVIWEKGVGALESIWVGAQAIYTTTWTGVASFLFGIWGKLKIAWAEVVSFMRKFWSKMTTDIKSGFVKAQTFFTKMVLKAQKKAMEFATGEEFDISVELNQAEKRERELVAGFNEDQDDAIADAEAKRKEDREAIQQEQDVFKQDIDRTRDAAKEKREKRLTVAQERQAAATERWLKATDTSDKKRQELEDSPTIDRAAMGAAEAGGRSSIGLSNARGIQSLMQGSTSIAERNLRANERTADNSEKQNRETIGA